mmetsp:Transcript_10316/g.22195  ORF Transcript_10316/g.22195 Transcript_10316/m.22195 type:complete len:154 (+) Transcript_10316:5592-6053(+)
MEKLERAVCVEREERQIDVGNESLHAVTRRERAVEEMAVGSKVLVRFGVEIGHGEAELPSLEKSIVNGGECHCFLVLELRLVDRRDDSKVRGGKFGKSDLQKSELTGRLGGESQQATSHHTSPTTSLRHWPMGAPGVLQTFGRRRYVKGDYAV